MQTRFASILEEVGNKILSSIEKGKRIVIFSPYTPDAISSSILLLNFLLDNDSETHLVFLNRLNKERIENIFGKEGYEEDIFLFLDTGSLYINDLRKYAKESNKEVYVFDHHFLISKDINLDNVYQINPNIFGINGCKEISTSVMIYYMLKEIGKEDLSFLSLIGSISEFQDEKEMNGINKEIVEELLNNEIIEIEKGLKLSSIRKPLYKSLSSSFEIFLPNITGSDENSTEFLKNIELYKNATISYEDLNNDEKKKLISEIVKIRIKYDLDYEKIVGDIYKIKDFNEIKDLRELVYLFYSSILTNKYYIISYLLGNKKYYEDLTNSFLSLRNSISLYLYNILQKKWEINSQGITIIKVPRDVKPEAILFLSNILSNQKIVKDRVFILLHDFSNEEYFASIRYSGEVCKKEIENILYNLYEKNGTSLSLYDPFGGIFLSKNKFDETLRNVKIYLKQEGLII